MSNIEPASDRRDSDPGAMDARLREATRVIGDLEARDSLKSQFLSNISHDLRTPLTAIITHAEILRDGILGPVSERQLESIHSIINGSRQLLGMVGEILTYARGSARQLSLDTSELDVRELLDQLGELNEALCDRNGLTLELDAASDLPMIVADREKLTHVLANLLGNAIAFTPSGGRVWVRTSVTSEGSVPHVLFEVGDTGIGIAPENHDLIFMEFAQVDSSPSRRHHGTGLGLTIARRFVELHGGRIWLTSAPGTGSLFYFTIPIAGKP